MNIFMKSIKIPPAEEYEVEDLEILSPTCKKLIRSVGIPADEAAENMDTLLQCLYFDTRKVPMTSAEVKQSMKAYRKKQRALGLPVIHRHHHHRHRNKDNKDNNNKDNNRGVEEAGDESDEGSVDSLSSGSSSSSSIERVDVEPLKVKQEKQQEKEKGKDKKKKKEKEGGKAKGKKEKGKDKGKEKGKGKKSKETKSEKKKRKAPEKEGNESAESSSPSVPSKKKRELKKEKGESNLSLSQKKKKKTNENNNFEEQHQQGKRRNGGKRMSCCIDLGAASSNSMKTSVSFPSTASSCITTTTTTRPRSPSAIDKVTPQDPTLQLAPQQRSFSAKTSSELRDTSALDSIQKEPSISLISSARASSLSPRGFELTSEMKELFIMENPSPLFSNKARIGKGGFGEVFTGKDKANGQTVAIKVLRRTLSDDKAVVKEIEMLRSCHHPNIVNYLRSYLYKDKISMVMEYCDGGSLQKLLSSIDLNEGQMSLLCKGILSALDYLHSQNRIHRDIKSDNILLNMNGVVKVADLGLCAELDGEEDSKNSVAGSRNWMAPEMIKRVHYGCKVDIWSLGAVLLEMMEKHPPYNNLRPLKVIFNTATKGAPPLKKPKKWSNELKDFLSRCFEMDPDKRPSAAELLQHDFITKKAAPNSKLVQAIGIVFLGNSIRMNGF